MYVEVILQVIIVTDTTGNSNINVTNTNDDSSNTDVSRVKDANGNDRITDISKPIIRAYLPAIVETLNSSIQTMRDNLHR